MPHFFANTPVERLIGEGIETRHLNEDVLGRALDTLYAHDVTALYWQVAQEAAQRLGLEVEYVHLDSTSFHVDGRDNSEAEPEEGVIQLTQGYSRDHRPDLNQVVLALICEQQAGIPLLMEPLSGNSNKKSEFRRVVLTHGAQLQVDHTPSYFVADSALYTEETLQALAERACLWITRVPATLSDVKRLLVQVDVAEMSPLADGYRVQELGAIYGGVKQRWLAIYSPGAHERALKTVSKQLLATTTQEAKAFAHLTRQAFAWRADAEAALAAFQSQLEVTEVAEAAIVAVPHYAAGGRRRRPAPHDLPDYRRACHSAPPSAAASRPARLFCSRHQPTRHRSPPPSGGARWLQRPGHLRARLSLSQGSPLSGLLPLPQVARTYHGSLDGHDPLFARLCRAPVPNSRPTHRSPAAFS